MAGFHTVIYLDSDEEETVESANLGDDDCIIVEDEDDFAAAAGDTEGAENGTLEKGPVLTPTINEIFKPYFDKIGGDGQGNTDCEKKVPEEVARVGVVAASFSLQEPLQQQQQQQQRPGVTTTWFGRVRLPFGVVAVGDFVALEPHEDGAPPRLAQILHLAETHEEETGIIEESHAHIRLLYRGCETAMGEVADTNELFLTPECRDVNINDVINKLKIDFGGSNNAGTSSAATEQQEQEEVFALKMEYVPNSGSYQNMGDVYDTVANARMGRCPLCLQKENICKPRFDDDNRSFMWRNELFRVGDALLLRPGSFRVPQTQALAAFYNRNEKSLEDVDESKTEHFRHYKNKNVKGSHRRWPNPAQIGVLVRVRKEEGIVTVRKIFRSEDILDWEEAAEYDFNHVFYSEDRIDLPVAAVVGKCVIMPKSLLPTRSTIDWWRDGHNRFYFNKTYDPTLGTFASLSPGILELYSSSSAAETAYPPMSRPPLKTMDLYAGCGGLSLGLEQSGVAKTFWAIEQSIETATAFDMNRNQEHVVMRDDCGDILTRAMKGIKSTASGRRIPEKGDVELIIAGPPCQGYSGLNRAKNTETSLHKNAQMATAVSFVDHYRPHFYVVENVMAFVQGHNLMLKLLLRALTHMGYQVSFGNLEAGNFGLPQTRRRFFLLAAAADQTLPVFPQPLHAFAPTSLAIHVDGKVFSSDGNGNAFSAAPFRCVTLREAISDLPFISSGASDLVRTYAFPPIGLFQKLMRVDGRKTVEHHITRNLTLLQEARIALVPKTPGSDWRDLPNAEILLPNGSKTARIKYVRNKPKNGVCGCNTGKPGKCKVAQKNTLLPWVKIHTADNNSQWLGNYGRNDWDGYLDTVVSNPHPEARVGRVLHPEQDRVLSVREFARAQGFPDNFGFAGSVLDKHRQIGNAVAVPVARAVGLAIREALTK